MTKDTSPPHQGYFADIDSSVTLLPSSARCSEMGGDQRAIADSGDIVDTSRTVHHRSATLFIGYTDTLDDSRYRMITVVSFIDSSIHIAFASIMGCHSWMTASGSNDFHESLETVAHGIGGIIHMFHFVVTDIGNRSLSNGGLRITVCADFIGSMLIFATVIALVIVSMLHANSGVTLSQIHDNNMQHVLEVPPHVDPTH